MKIAGSETGLGIRCTENYLNEVNPVTSATKKSWESSLSIVSLACCSGCGTKAPSNPFYLCWNPNIRPAETLGDQTLSGVLALANSFKQADAGRHRDIQAFHAPGHGDAHQHVAFFLRQSPQPFALPAQYQGQRPAQVGVEDIRIGLLTGARQPDAGLFQRRRVRARFNLRKEPPL